LLDALPQGQPYTGNFHHIAEFASLADFEPFVAAMKPKD
jgi:hypothetical protein